MLGLVNVEYWTLVAAFLVSGVLLLVAAINLMTVFELDFNAITPREFVSLFRPAEVAQCMIHTATAAAVILFAFRWHALVANAPLHLLAYLSYQHALHDGLDVTAVEAALPKLKARTAQRLAAALLLFLYYVARLSLYHRFD